MTRGNASTIKRVKVPELDASAIGQRIAAARRRRKYRQLDLAAATGRSHNIIVAWETGRRLPNRESLVALSYALRRKIDWIVLGKGSRQGRREKQGNSFNPPTRAQEGR